jgi:phosphomannomutase/phosphoglucomutase
MQDGYIADLSNKLRLKRRLKAVVACGNGTASIFAPRVLSAIGCEVVPLDCEPDHSFPNCDPNPEDLKMLNRTAEAVLASGADVGFAFDGDGDRCGVIDNRGKAIFADKIGLLLARSISAEHRGCRFVVDVKSTALFATDPVLHAQGATTEYWKTGHSYIKRRTAEIGALAGFEKSGHFFFREPLGRGYDDGLASALAVCAMLDQAGDRSLASLHGDLPVTWSSPTMSPHCDDELKYDVVQRIRNHLANLRAAGERLGGYGITSLIEINGVRATLQDGSWFLVRASSNKPELTIVCESPVSESRMRDVFADVKSLLSSSPEVGDFNQTI